VWRQNQQPDNGCGPVEIKDFIWEKSTLQWTALAIVFKSGEQHPDMSQHQSKWKWKFQLPVSQT
jgi:hypothetical protein